MLDSHGIFLADAACGAVPAVIAVLRVDDRLTNQVVRAHQVPIVDLDGQLRLQGEGDLKLKAPVNKVVVKQTTSGPLSNKNF